MARIIIAKFKDREEYFTSVEAFQQHYPGRSYRSIMDALSRKKIDYSDEEVTIRREVLKGQKYKKGGIDF